MNSSGSHRRPWVIRDLRAPNVATPVRRFEPYEPPESPSWRWTPRLSFRSVAGDLAGVALAAAAMLAFLLLLLRR